MDCETYRMRMQEVKALDDVQGNDAPFPTPVQLLLAFTALQGLAQVAALCNMPGYCILWVALSKVKLAVLANI